MQGAEPHFSKTYQARKDNYKLKENVKISRTRKSPTQKGQGENKTKTMTLKLRTELKRKPERREKDESASRKSTRKKNVMQTLLTSPDKSRKS